MIISSNVALSMKFTARFLADFELDKIKHHTQRLFPAFREGGSVGELTALQIVQAFRMLGIQLQEMATHRVGSHPRNKIVAEACGFETFWVARVTTGSALTDKSWPSTSRGKILAI
jgi:hypothetical protein